MRSGDGRADMLAHLEKLRTDAAKWRAAKTARGPEKRQLFTMMAKHLTELADNLQRELQRIPA